MSKKSFIHTATEKDNSPLISEELIKRHQVKDTPFTIIELNKDENNKIFFGTLGKYRITEDYKTLEECETEVNIINWNKITNICALLIETLNNNKL